MTALQNAIQQIPDWRTLSAADLHSQLTTPQRKPKPENARVWSAAGIAEAYGVFVAETIFAALESSGLKAIANRFAGIGLKTTDPQWLANADAIIASGALSQPHPVTGEPIADAETQEALKFIGFEDATTLWTDPLTEPEAEAARQAILNEEQRQGDLEALRAEIENNYLNPAESDPAQTVAAVRAAIKATL